MNNEKLGRYIAYILRHKPDSIGLKIDKNGYAFVDELIEKINSTGKYRNVLTVEKLSEIVATDNKQRYSFNENKTKIRAVQGHSFSVDVAKKGIPPIILYHGTSCDAYEKIKKSGIKKMNRDFVHLSKDLETAQKVGMRHCKKEKDLVVLIIDTKKMVYDGYEFYVAENGVWLSDYIPSKYIKKYKG